MASNPYSSNAGLGASLRDPAWIRAQIMNWLRAAGVANPSANPFAQRLMGRANEAGSLADLYDVTDENRQQFIQNWAGNQWGGAASPQDFSRQGIQNRIAQLGAGGDNPLRTGDPESDIATMREWQALANRGRGNRWQQVADLGVQRQGDEFLNSFINNQNQNAYFADYAAGRATPQPAAGGPPPTSAANPWAAKPAVPAQPGGMETPATMASSPATPLPVTTTPLPGGGSAGTINVPAAGAQTGAVAPTQQFQSAMDLYNYMLAGHDPRNLGTEGMRGPGRAFSFGGVTYNPAEQQGYGRNDRDPNKRFGGGAAWTGLMKRLKLLVDQRNAERAGQGDFPAVPGAGGAATDEELARLAADWAIRKYRGQTGIHYTSSTGRPVA